MAPACLDEELLAGYIEGNLSDAERERVERHLAGCDGCLQVFLLCRNMAQEAVSADLSPVPARVTDSAIKGIQKQKKQTFEPLKKRFRQSARELYSKVSDVLSPSPLGGLEAVPVRSGKLATSRNGVVIRKTIAQTPTEITIEKTLQGNAHIKVHFPGHGKRSKGIRVTLQKGDREVSSALIEKSGYVLFEDVPFGHYSLVFLRNGDVFGTYLFELKETNNGGR